MNFRCALGHSENPYRTCRKHGFLVVHVQESELRDRPCSDAPAPSTPSLALSMRACPGSSLGGSWFALVPRGTTDYLIKPMETWNLGGPRSRFWHALQTMKLHFGIVYAILGTGDKSMPRSPLGHRKWTPAGCS